MEMKNKKILIIGGTGALGKSLSQRWYSDNQIIVFSRNEHKQEDMKREFPKITYRLGNIKDKSAILRVMYEFKPHVIVNTAAIKTVWVAQDNPYETILVNIVGHQNLVDCVRECSHKIESLMFISTDKACSPVNVYGMSKAIAEQIYVNYAKEHSDIKVVLARYGNVLNSTGSIIPIFKEMIEKGAEFIPITHFGMTRFLLTLEEAINLIEWAYHHKDSHGKIVVPKIRSLKLIDFVKAIAKSCGKEDIELKKIPIRNGEKLHEEMVSSIEFQRTVEYENYLMIGYERKNEDYDHKPFSSEYAIIDGDKAKDFLKEKGVL